MNKELISVDEARTLVAAMAKPLEPVRMAIERALGLAVAENVYAPIDTPAFDQSSMDGYAFRYEDRAEPLTLQGEVPAGSAQPLALFKKHTMRIFTGGPLPDGADTVVMQEKVAVSGDRIQVKDQLIKKGTFVRTRGADIKLGELVLEKKTLLSATKIGILASIGIGEIRAFPPPAISIIATGKELQKPGNSLLFGQIYESNSYFLYAGLRQAFVREIRTLHADDELNIVRENLALALENSDIVLLTGGVSVGDYDFVRKAADLNGIVCQFHKVKQKPGKPFYFGTKGNQLIFGLPGNPASVITCFYEYVLPAINQMMQWPKNKLETAALKEPFYKAEGLTQFLKGYVENGIVSILAGQESYRLRSFAGANCLVSLDEQKLDFEKGEEVTIRLLPA